MITSFLTSLQILQDCIIWQCVCKHGPMRSVLSQLRQALRYRRDLLAIELTQQGEPYTAAVLLWVLDFADLAALCLEFLCSFWGKCTFSASK